MKAAHQKGLMPAHKALFVQLQPKNAQLNMHEENIALAA
jgi:hypothetical protein